MNNSPLPQVSASDFNSQLPLADQLAFLCRYGMLAPSVHNTQPWLVAIAGSKLLISIQPKRMLRYGDPSARETWISLGCFTENILMAARSLGIKILATAYQYDDLSQAVAELQFGPASDNDSIDTSCLEAMANRRSDRSHYTTQEIPVTAVKQIELCPQEDDVSIMVTTSREIINQVADLTGRGISMALGQPEFRAELAEYIRPNWSNHQYGLFGYNLGYGTIRSALEPVLVRHGIGIGAHGRAEAAAMRSAAGLVMVFTRGDTAQFWLQAGMAYQRAGVEAAKLGLAQATTAAVVEAADFHKDIEQLMNTSLRLQTIMRIGYSQKPAAHSPRLPVSEIVTT